MILIESASNKIVKETSKLKNKKERDKKGKFIIEGENLVSEINDDWKVDYFIFSESYFNKENKYQKINNNYYVLKDKVFNTISDTVSPQGVMAICYKKKFQIETFISKQNAFILIGEEITDPGNMGTLIRTAAAAGCNGIVLSEGCVDVYNPKVIRATTGALFKIPFVENINITNIIQHLKEYNIKIIAAHLKGNITPYSVNMSEGVAVLVGNEARGLSDDATLLADTLVKIPMFGDVESLNASVASSILLYEVVRQRIIK